MVVVSELLCVCTTLSVLLVYLRCICRRYDIVGLTDGASDGKANAITSANMFFYYSVCTACVSMCLWG